ncbi:MAG: acetylglutamate kinase [Heyndrickxia sp.]
MSYLIIKCGGSITEKLPDSFFKNIAALQTEFQIKPIIVHGGGPQVSTLLGKLQIESKFIDGLRVTNEPVLEVVEMVLSGTANKQIVRNLLAVGAKGIGLSGADGKLLEAKLVEDHRKVGLVGEVISVNNSLLDLLLLHHYIPVISPVAVDRDSRPLNINADEAAAAISKAYQAPICMITDVPGVMKEGKVISTMTKAEIEGYIDTGIIYGGMVPKVKAALASIQQGVKEVVIMNGLEEDNLIKYVRKEPIGTLVRLEEELIDA